MIIAVLGYIFYDNFLSLGRSWIAHGKLWPAAGLWWVYVPTLLVALWMLWRSQRLRRRRRAAA